MVRTYTSHVFEQLDYSKCKHLNPTNHLLSHYLVMFFRLLHLHPEVSGRAQRRLYVHGNHRGTKGKREVDVVCLLVGMGEGESSYSGGK